MRRSDVKAIIAIVVGGLIGTWIIFINFIEIAVFNMNPGGNVVVFSPQSISSAFMGLFGILINNCCGLFVLLNKTENENVPSLEKSEM